MITFAGISLQTLEICATVLNDRIDTSANMLRLNRQHPGVLPLGVAVRYSRNYFQARAQLDQLHDELERQIGAMVCL